MDMRFVGRLTGSVPGLTYNANLLSLSNATPNRKPLRVAIQMGV
jgi:hypothetical protein